MGKKNFFGFAVFAVIAGGVFLSESDVSVGFSEAEPVQPNWAAITAWPTLQVDMIEAQPDPNRQITAIVLDDSGSMEDDIDAAKAAVIGALGAMEASDPDRCDWAERGHDPAVFDGRRRPTRAARFAGTHRR